LSSPGVKKGRPYAFIDYIYPDFAVNAVREHPCPI
jgi:hypothetical protein